MPKIIQSFRRYPRNTLGFITSNMEEYCIALVEPRSKTIPCLRESNFALFSLKTICQFFYSCLQHERVLKILYFHIFNIAKFGKIYVWTITN